MLKCGAILLLAAALVSGKSVPTKLNRFRPNGRIVGGTEAKIEDNPWQVSLEAFGIHNCGGSIIGPDTIITAAHCIDGIISFFYEVISGTDDLLATSTRSTIKRSIVHEGYSGLSNDVAIIILNEPLVFDERTQAVPLADVEPDVNDTIRVSGWGLLHEQDLLTPNRLYSVEIPIVDRQQCADAYSVFDDAVVDETMICAGVPQGGKDSCSGDSGGPLTKDGQLIGIVSWGYGCAEPGYPGVNTNIAAVREWIRTTTGI